MKNNSEYLGSGYFLVRTDQPKYHPDGSIFTIKTTDQVLMSVSLDYPDSFAIIWNTSLSPDKFLEQACRLIVALGRKPHHCRPMETGNPIAVAKLPQQEGTSGTINIAPSYSDFGYNNVMLLPLLEIPFNKLRWPLTVEDIKQAYLAKGESSGFTKK